MHRSTNYFNWYSCDVWIIKRLIERIDKHVPGVGLDKRRTENGEFHMRLRFRGYCSCGWESARNLNESTALEWAIDHAYYIGRDIEGNQG